MKRIAFFIPDLRGGGAEKAVLNLVKGMSERGYAVDLVMIKAAGIHLGEVPEQVRIVDLHKKRALYAVFALAKYLRQYKPLVLISHLSHCNIIAILAKKTVKGSSKLILVEQSALPKDDLLLGIKEKFVIWMMRRLYKGSNVVVAVSKNTARNIESKLGLEKGTVRCIYNPVVNEEMVKRSNEGLPHAWFEQKEIPVFLAAGRLEPQKDFETLLKAFSIVRQHRPARLIILGEGSLRNKLEQYISVLGINQDVSMPGFAVNPYSYMKHADAFVLSSVYEGLPTVLIEAMACGCAVVATDCPEGPSEILENGIYGMMAPVGNAAALAQAMDQTLKMKKDKERLQARAGYFSVERSVSAYLDLAREITGIPNR